MYRTASRRLLAGANLGDASLGFLIPQSVIFGGSRFFSSTSTQSVANHDQNQRAPTETASSSSQSDSTTSAPGRSTSSNSEDSRRYQRQRPRAAEYQDEQARVLQASLRHAFFMDDCLQMLIDRIGSGEELQKLVHSERISKLSGFA